MPADLLIAGSMAIGGTVKNETEKDAVIFILFLSGSNEVSFTMIKLWFLQMESGGFGKADIAAVSS